MPPSGPAWRLASRDTISNKEKKSSAGRISAAMVADTVGRAPRGLNDGKGFVFISHTGEVFPSGFLPTSGVNVRLANRTERDNRVTVDNGFFETLGVQLELGRLFSAADVAPDAPAVTLLSDKFWRSHFAGDTRVVGKSLVVNGKVYHHRRIGAIFRGDGRR